MKIYYKVRNFDKLAISFGISPDNLLEYKFLFIFENRNIFEKLKL